MASSLKESRRESLSLFKHQKQKESAFKLLLASKTCASSRNLIIKEIESSRMRNSSQFKQVENLSSHRTTTRTINKSKSKMLQPINADEKKVESIRSKILRAKKWVSGSTGMFIVNNVSLESREVDSKYRKNLLETVRRLEQRATHK